jgi:hypothetical protein
VPLGSGEHAPSAADRTIENPVRVARILDTLANRTQEDSRACSTRF